MVVDQAILTISTSGTRKDGYSAAMIAAKPGKRRARVSCTARSGRWRSTP